LELVDLDPHDKIYMEEIILVKLSFENLRDVSRVVSW
jgi:hypothetical protein